MAAVVHASTCLIPQDDPEGNAKATAAAAASRHPHESPSRGMYTAAVPALIGGLLFGYAIGFTSPAFNVNDDHVRAGNLDTMMAMSQDDITWFGSVLNIGVGVASLVSGYPVDRYGKRWGMAASHVLMALGYVILLTTPVVVSKDIPTPHNASFVAPSNADAIIQLCAARVVMGISSGVACVTCASYMSEIATLRLRGVLGALFQNALVAGIVLAYLVGLFTNWQGVSYVAIALAGLGLAASLCVHESPQWLVTRGRREEAEQSLRKMRSPESDIQGLMAVLHAQARAGKTPDARSEPGAESSTDRFIRALSEPPRGWALVVGLGLMTAAQLNGISAVTAYAGKILGQVFTDPDQANAFAFYGQLIKLGVTSVASYLMARLPRRGMLAASLGGMIVSCCFLCLYFFDDTLPAGLVMVGYVGYLVSYAMGAGALSWSMLGEIFHPEIRGSACALVTLWNAILTFYVSKSISFYTDAFGGGDGASRTESNRARGYVFLMYGATACLGLAFSVACVPETLGKSYKRVEQEMLARGAHCCGGSSRGARGYVEGSDDDDDGGGADSDAAAPLAGDGKPGV